MKKKFLLIVMAVFISMACMCFFAACDDEEDNEPKVYTVTFDSDGGTAVEAQEVESGQKATEPTAPTRAGYTFDGWYYGDKEWSFIGYVVTKDMKLTAKWTPVQQGGGDNTGGNDNPGGGNECVHDFTSKTKTTEYLKTSATCTSPAVYYYKCANCEEKGTYTYTDGDALQHSYTSKTMTIEYAQTIPTCQTVGVYYYKCENCTDHGTNTYSVGNKTAHDLDTNHICTMCSNGYIYFGEYPQTIKAESVTITDTTDSRGYYLGSDGAYYAKVTATPYGSGYKFSNESTVTNGTVYYFKAEPILWRIISQSNDTAMILCDSIIANKAFDSSSNNYKESDIRAWLNDQFYNTAFTALERELILTTTVDNSVASTGYSPNPNVCENTEDKIFLLSYAEVTNSAYGFSPGYSRQMQTSDYSRATGAYMSNDSSYYGNGDWWLRSPYLDYSRLARGVNIDGYVDYYYVSFTYSGVVPALQIRL